MGECGLVFRYGLRIFKSCQTLPGEPVGGSEGIIGGGGAVEVVGGSGEQCIPNSRALLFIKDRDRRLHGTRARRAWVTGTGTRQRDGVSGGAKVVRRKSFRIRGLNRRRVEGRNNN